MLAAEHARDLLAAPGGMVEVFHTFQLALALAVAGDHQTLTALVKHAAADPRPDYAEVLAPVAEALGHLVAGRPAAAVDLLSNLGAHTERLGGVRVEREIIHDTLARALVDASEPDRAAHLLHHRTSTRHHHNYEHHLLTPGPTSLAPNSPAPPRAPTNTVGPGLRVSTPPNISLGLTNAFVMRDRRNFSLIAVPGAGDEPIYFISHGSRYQDDNSARNPASLRRLAKRRS